MEMANRNIEINYKTNEGYDILYPNVTARNVIDFNDDVNLILKNSTKALYGLDNEAVPDDVFLALAIGTGNYGYKFHVQLVDGTPVPGATISGVTGLDGGTVVTDADGNAVGTSTSMTVEVTMLATYIDIDDSTVSVVSTGKITAVSDVVLNGMAGSYKTITSSQIVTLSPLAVSVDLCLVGGGGGGGGGAKYNTRDCGGGGGGGGHVTNVLNISVASLTDRRIQFSIGSGGYRGSNSSTPYTPGTNGGAGGTTSATILETSLQYSATGGSGGKTPPVDTEWTGGKGGSGNGNGGDGGSMDGTSKKSGGAGSGYIFEESALGLAGGGGGGGGGADGNASGGVGGDPYGGDGGNWGAGVSPGDTGAGPGGGGGGSPGTYSAPYVAGLGHSGIAYIRSHYD